MGSDSPERGARGPQDSRPAAPKTSHDASRTARIEDVHEIARAMPHVTVEYGSLGNPVYQVGGKSFVFFRNPRPDAVDPETGERYDDVMVFWVPSEADKLALVQDRTTPFFTTPHFDGHLSVLLRGSHLGRLTRQELAEIIEDAWLSRASRRRAAAWLEAQRLGRTAASGQAGSHRASGP
ncbi:MAG TPA: MmcQ/YjbR family DNA-binding protein [Jiangellaceae bacterium]